MNLLWRWSKLKDREHVCALITSCPWKKNSRKDLSRKDREFLKLGCLASCRSEATNSKWVKHAELDMAFWLLTALFRKSSEDKSYSSYTDLSEIRMKADPCSCSFSENGKVSGHLVNFRLKLVLQVTKWNPIWTPVPCLSALIIRKTVVFSIFY
jgi:hypothetical protein